ncbi:class I SAM-dependent methyltransferase [Methanogenium sp. MK-MG]|uniref:class I SAM-dependent methyltransferase n=1 Tax=Methanogenium sp. MK-MG TaxID=2599926 RepID=UPI0013E9D687|nr:class I SAM-dependent methyltransferase [Methanogenium sp. MK-MG]
MKWDTEKRAAQYDDLAARTVPDMKHFYATVTDALPEQSMRVLELGCGTGLLTARIRKAHPEAAVICIDSSPAMLAVARQKPELEDVTWMQGDIRDPWPTGPFDAVVSTFCLLALEPDGQRTVLKRAYRTLRPGGVCITGCVVRPATAEEEKCQLARWETFMQDAGLDPEEVRRQRASWDGARARIPTPDGFREMLREAGFTRIRCPYHRGLYTVFVAER